MRYKQLQAARDSVQHAIDHLINNPHQITILNRQVDFAAVRILHLALKDIKDEISYPERFNLDGTRRKITTYPSSTLGPIHRWKQ